MTVNTNSESKMCGLPRRGSQEFYWSCIWKACRNDYFIIISFCMVTGKYRQLGNTLLEVQRTGTRWWAKTVSRFQFASFVSFANSCRIRSCDTQLIKPVTDGSIFTKLYWSHNCQFCYIIQLTWNYTSDFCHQSFNKSFSMHLRKRLEY